MFTVLGKTLVSGERFTFLVTYIGKPPKKIKGDVQV